MATQNQQENILSALIESEIENDTTAWDDDIITQVIDSDDSAKNRQPIRGVDPSLFIHETTPIIHSDNNDVYTSVCQEKSKRSRKPKSDKIVLATSYITEKEIIKNKEMTYLYNNINKQSDDNSARSEAFANLENKNTLAITLKCTKACTHVTTKNDNGDFGTCYRETCSFAHSVDEWQPPKCQFGSTCRIRHGRVNKDCVVDPNTKCKFIHDDESVTNWKKRTGQLIPDLPSTNEDSRKPVVKSEIKSEIKNISATITRPYVAEKPSVWRSIIKNDDVGDPNTKCKIIPDDESDKHIISSSDLNKTISSKKSYKYDDDHRKPRSKHHRDLKSAVQIIRVPTTELAEIAIKAALERGILNIQVELI